MKELRIKNFVKKYDYEWIPPHTYYSDLPPSTYTKETRKPRYLLYPCGIGSGEPMTENIFFLNLSDETLDLVQSAMGGFQTCGDDILTVSSNGYSYKDVEPGEAVLVDTYDAIYDSDFLIQEQVIISSKKDGLIKLIGSATKGDTKEQVLMWDTGEPHKGVIMDKLHASGD